MNSTPAFFISFVGTEAFIEAAGADADGMAYGPRDHKGFDSVYSSVVRQGYGVTLTNWKGLASARPPS